MNVIPHEENTMIKAYPIIGDRYWGRYDNLQAGKDIYETGEDLWFKAYQLDDKSFALSEQSETL